MQVVSMVEQVRVLSMHPLDGRGQPSIDRDEAIRILRGHLELDEMEYYTDDELWDRWRTECGAVSPDDINATVVDRMAFRIRAGI